MKTAAALLALLALAACNGQVSHKGVNVLATIPHDTAAFTQGLEFDGGRLFESTGRYGASELREINPATGSVLRRMPLGDAYFGEGLTVVGDSIIVLTWRENTALVYDRDSFRLTGSHSYDGEGWGLCHDGSRLVMSDGSDVLTFRDPETFAVTGTVAVTLDDEPVSRLNELECRGNRVYANVWLTETIVEINPATGKVTAEIDAGGLHEGAGGDAVLNGIAWDEANNAFLITGKLWPEMFRVRFE